MAASVCSSSRSRFGFVRAACIVFCCCSLILLPDYCCCSSDAGETAAAAFHGQERDAVVDIVGRALICFNDRYIYSGCQASFRLGPEGALDVPPGCADAFCGGPCLAETELVLRCVDGIMLDSFRFYNGASAADVRFALDRGCGHSPLRGDFDVLQRLDDGHFYGSGGDGTRRLSVKNSLAAALPQLLMATAILVW